MAELYYEGLYKGNKVRFKRTFSGRVFSEDECERLCLGEVLLCEDLINVHHNRYSAEVHLSESTFARKDSGRVVNYLGINVKRFIKEELRCVYGRILSEDEIALLNQGQRLYVENCVNRQGKKFNCEVSYGPKADGSIGLQCHFDDL